jgi:hypothetical protein
VDRVVLKELTDAGGISKRRSRSDQRHVSPTEEKRAQAYARSIKVIVRKKNCKKIRVKDQQKGRKA